MTTFTINQDVQLCPTKTEQGYRSWARLDGSRAEVMELLGPSRNQKVRVKIKKGEWKGLYVLPSELLKPLPN